MPTHIAQADLPYTPRQVFDLVADIEHYPAFLRHVVSARITARKGNTLWVDQVVRFGVLRPRFTTRADLDPPFGIHVVCADSPFGTLDERWSFADGPSGGTRLQCRTHYEFRSVFMRMALSKVLGDLLAATMQGFQARARQLYGPGDGLR